MSKDCGVVNCQRTESKHTHTGPLGLGERVVLVPNSIGASAECYRNSRGVLKATQDGMGLVDLGDRSLWVQMVDMKRARSWKPPQRRRPIFRRPVVLDAEEPLLPFGES